MATSGIDNRRHRSFSARAMHFPSSFADIPGITLYDPLAELLGAPVDGLIEYRFADAVKLAGHCCPTVAGAWLMTTKALRALYGSATPVRGQITVALGETEDEGVAGVIASIATLLTGAAGIGGFKGLGGRQVRRGLLRYAAPGVAGLRFTRLDTGLTVNANFWPKSKFSDPRLGQLLPAVIAGTASVDETALFRRLWQARIMDLLTRGAADPDVVSIEVVPQ